MRGKMRHFTILKELRWLFIIHWFAKGTYYLKLVSGLAQRHQCSSLPIKKKTEWFGVEVSMFLPLPRPSPPPPFKKSMNEKKITSKPAAIQFFLLDSGSAEKVQFPHKHLLSLFLPGSVQGKVNGQDVPHMPLKHVKKKMSSTIKLMQRRTRAEQANAAGAQFSRGNNALTKLKVRGVNRSTDIS